MIAVLIILAVFSVPLMAIGSSTYLKAKRLQADGGSAKLRAELDSMRRGHAELQARIEVLETIATSETPRLPARSEASLEELRELELASRRS